jgi:hypothetical protein
VKLESQAGILTMKKEAEDNRNLITESNQTLKELIIAEEGNQLKQYVSTYEGLKTIHEENQGEINLIKEIKVNQERHLTTNMEISSK